jgi:hypothetical protein
MSKIIHTIKISNGTGGTVEATRTSATRAYAACVVCIVTARTVELQEAAREEARVELAKQEDLLARRMERLGMGVDEARAAYPTLSGDAKWSHDGPYGIVHADYLINLLTQQVNAPQATIGAQVVESWHRDAKLAATAASVYRNKRKNGCAFDVRTDITTRETGSRRSKS